MSGENMCEADQVDLNLVLLGKSGAGISASGNTILWDKKFTSKKSLKSITQQYQKETCKIDGVRLAVYDTPGLFNTEKSNSEVQKEWRSVLQLYDSVPTVYLLVIKADRFTHEGKKAVEDMGMFLGQELQQHTWILFTGEDEWQDEGVSILDFINGTDELKAVMQTYGHRYHVFNNKISSHDQVQNLIRKVFPREIAVMPHNAPERRIVLLGKVGVGKSASGNTILGKCSFRSEGSFSAVTKCCSVESEKIDGRKVIVVDTPGFFDTELTEDELAKELAKSVHQSAPGPHAFLYVVSLSERFLENDEKVIGEMSSHFGRNMESYTIVLFAKGDQLTGRPIEAYMEQNKVLKGFLSKCDNRYHVLDNKCRNLCQVTELLQKIEVMVDKNNGEHYTTDMYEEAHRSPFERFWENMREFFRILARRLRGGRYRYSSTEQTPSDQLLLLQHPHNE